MWPTILPTLVLNRALLVPESRANINGWTSSMYKCFWTVMAISFAWFFYPAYIFKALSIFLTSFVFIDLYWTNYKWTTYLPINTNAIYDKYAYQKYSPLYISLGNLIAMTATALTCVFVTEWSQIHESFGASIMSSVKRKANDQNSIPNSSAGMVDVGCHTAVFYFVLIPSSIIVAIAGFALGFHSPTIILSGYMVPGNGIATLTPRAAATSTVEQVEASWWP
ncbi:hypothetical protein V1517DRAFT_345778 [Lipomyces orientalis]|uniref:Uncharacterized protein n=1 Tax=Lipomyces orientalis TaxID=1233043 RepID=A0ACC3TQ97_9ASCO